MRLFTSLLYATLLFCANAAAHVPEQLRGTWVWQIDGRNLIVLAVEPGPGNAAGKIQCPTQLMVSQAGSGLVVSRIQMPAQIAALRYVREAAGGHVLEYTGPDGLPRDFVLRPEGKDAVAFSFGTDPSMTLVAHFTRAPTRPVDPTAMATDWDAARSYLARGPVPPSNPEMARIFAEDQADRQAGLKTDWTVVGPRDVARRVRVRQMLDAGELRSGDDYQTAAFVFQHGEKPDDYLLAHVLAMAAQSQGRADAGWIAMATLDRYLRSIDKSQIIGTQLGAPVDGATLVPDSLRLALGVPTLAQQEAQWRELQRQSQQGP